MTGPRTTASLAGSVVTVRGPVAPSSLGATLVGEHLVADFATPDDSDAGWARIGRVRPRAATEVRFSRLPVGIDVLGRLAMGAYNDDDLRLDEHTAAAAAVTFRASGGGAIVTLTPGGCGADPAGLARVAYRSGVAVVRAAGWQHPAWSPELDALDADELASRLVAEVVGEHPAGVLVVGADAVDASGRALLEASTVAALTTGAPLVLHLDRIDDRLGLDCAAKAAVAEPGAVLAAVDRLIAAGIAAERIAIAGAARLAHPDTTLLEPLLERGVRLAFDGLGRIPTVRTEVADHRVAVLLVELAARGAADRALLGTGIAQKHRLTAFGGNGHEFVLSQFVPYLRMLGADDELIDAATIANAARFLTFADPIAPAPTTEDVA